MDDIKDEALRPGLADSDPVLKAWLNAPEQAYNSFATLEEAVGYAKKRAPERAKTLVS